MNHFLRTRPHSLILTTSFIALISNHAFAGKEEELAARKIQKAYRNHLQKRLIRSENRVFNNLKASVIGGLQPPENRLALDTLKAQDEQLIRRLPIDNRLNLILGASKSECTENHSVDKRDLAQWISLYGDHFVSHAINKQNVEKVLHSKTLKPAELVLRETGRVSWESQKSLDAVRGTTVLDPQISSLVTDLVPYSPCKGLAYVKAKKINGILEVFVRTENESQWTQLPKLFVNPKNQGEKDYNEFREENDERLVDQLSTTDYSTLLDLELPILNCSSPVTLKEAKNGSLLRRRMARPLGMFPNPWFYLETDATALMQMKEIEKIATSHSLSDVLLTLDEKSGRGLDRNLNEMSKKYERSLKSFFEQKKLRDPAYHPLIDELARRVSAEQIAHVRQIQLDRVHHLQPDISFTYNSVNWQYGAVAILTPYDEKRMWNPNGLRLSKGKEIRTKQPYASTGEFQKIILDSPDVLILGPKATLNSLHKMAGLKIIYTEDLTPEQKETFGLASYQ